MTVQGSENSSRRGRRSSTMGGMPSMTCRGGAGAATCARRCTCSPTPASSGSLAGRRGRVRRRHRRRVPPGRGHLAGQLVRREVRRHDLPRLRRRRPWSTPPCCGCCGSCTRSGRTRRSPPTWSTRLAGGGRAARDAHVLLATNDGEDPDAAPRSPGRAADHDAVGLTVCPGRWLSRGPRTGHCRGRRMGPSLHERAAPGRRPAEQYVLTLSCPDKQGIVHAVSSYLFMTGCNIEDSQQFGDHDTGLFFMRVHFSAEAPVTVEKLRASFAAIGDSFRMDWQIHRAERADADRADGQQVRALPQRPAVPRPHRCAAGRDRGGRLQPHGLRRARRLVRHPLPPHPRDEGHEAEAEARCSTSCARRTSNWSCWPGTCRCSRTTCASR